MPRPRPRHPIAVHRARKLRETHTNAEKLLWRHLRDRRLFGVKFRRQHPVGPFIVDFVAEEERIVVELDGSQHALEAELRKDADRTGEIERRGYRVIRFWNSEVLGNREGVLEAILAAMGKT